MKGIIRIREWWSPSLMRKVQHGDLWQPSEMLFTPRLKDPGKKERHAVVVSFRF